jgi:hypothetical protein
LPRRRRLGLLRLFGGFALGFVLWTTLHASYHRVLSFGTARIARWTAPDFRLSLREQSLAVRHRAARQETPFAGLPFLSFHFVVLVTLYSLWQRRTDRTALARLGIAAAAIVAGHLVALQFWLLAFLHWKSSGFAPFLWVALWQSYFLVGGYAIVFALSWLLFGERSSNSTLQLNARR